MDRENRLRRRLKDAERIKKYLVRNNAPKTKISEIGRLVNFLDEELNRERIINTLTNVYLGNK
ncbi:hypothetical protein [Staphylococcus aureus]